jgi:hypothetical protein
MFRFHIYFFLIFLYITDSVSAQRAFVGAAIQQVNLDSLILTVRQLSGDTTIVINGITDTIKSRFSFDQGNEKTAQFLKHRLESFGLQGMEQPFPGNGKNIYAIQTGSVFPEQCYMVCAHYDNLPDAPVNYGADDNASGVAAVLESARILSKYTLPYTIFYVFFDQEEQGLWGSEYFCNLHDVGAQPVLGVINMDMIAYDGNNDSAANIHIRTVGGDQLISDKLTEVNNLYAVSLHLNIINPPSFQSDHASFWKYFMPAVMFIEDDKHDFNPGYHSLNDQLDSFNRSYFHRMTMLATGSLADVASDSLHVGTNEYTALNQDATIYPNPTIKNQIMVSHLHGKSVYIKIINANGELILEDNMAPQNEQITLELPFTIPSGLYHMQVIADEYKLNRRFLKQ